MIGRIIDIVNNFISKRKSIYYSKLISGGKALVSGDAKLSFPENISVGYDTMINGGGTMIYASQNAKIQIGSHCMISYNVCIRTLTHEYSRVDIPIKHQPHIEKDVVIKDDVWVGFGAIIMPGVTIGEGCVIGAGAVVTKDCKPYGVYVGVPAQLLKIRK